LISFLDRFLGIASVVVLNKRVRRAGFAALATTPALADANMYELAVSFVFIT
jgi:hypothetical protein